MSARSLCAFSLLVIAASGPADARAMRIEIDDAQRVTISGSSDSLRSTVEELCHRAGVELRAFDLRDRPVTAEYVEIPLAEAFARLLRGEAFLAGLRPARAGGRPRVAWLRVSGSGGGLVDSAPVPNRVRDTAASAIPAASGFDFGPNPRLVETALTSKDPTARGRARQVVLDGLRDDPTPLQRFVERDTAQTVSELAEFPHATEFLRALQTVTVDPRERSRLQSILGQVQVRQAQD